MEKHYCIVLRTTDYKDYDKILALFSRSHGRIDAQARGARRLKSEFGPIAQPLACGEFEFYKKNDKLFLTGALIRQEFYHIQNDYDKYMSACVMLELTDKLLQNADEYEELFLTLIYALFAMEQGKLSYLQALAYFLARVVEMMGIFPAIGSCAVCGSPAQGPVAAFSFEEGGEICPQCSPHVKAVKVPRSVLLGLIILANTKPKEANGITLEERDARGVVKLLERYLDAMMEIKLKTMKCFHTNAERK